MEQCEQLHGGTMLECALITCPVKRSPQWIKCHCSPEANSSRDCGDPWWGCLCFGNPVCVLVRVTTGYQYMMSYGA